MIKIEELYDLNRTRGGKFLRGYTYPWEVLTDIPEIILSIGEMLPADEYTQIAEGIWVHVTAQIAPTAYIGAPCILGAKTQVRHGAFIRGAALVGDGCVVGNSVELKNVILFDGVQVPHYNYVGDSILGYKAHMGAGAVTSNVKSDKSLVTIHCDPPIATGMKKVGAMLGDFVEVGCNSVLNPGTVVGRHTNIYPQSSVRGVLPPDSIYKGKDSIVKKA